ncbi:sensor histidine kinase [Secundilactobacillus collinoides]|uniref:sensor histidine kinase n=1 Tax=Secundilactobacillus collinoides TaxID=33960 RepID=UPI0006D024A2|nr:HAMP domain-containing sensor histidine kinase [Secundilactobacillus collinoides]
MLLGHIARSKNNVYYYHLKSVTKQDVKENETGVQYDVWLRLDDVIDLMGKIVATILGIALLSFIIGTALIYWVAKRLNRPLVQLTRSSKIHTKDVETAGTAQLPVPKTPQEVHDLSIEFNHLLASLNQRSEADRQFVSNASHELRTPIAGIRGHVEMIKRHGDEHPEIIPTSLDFIDKESKRMQTMIENLLKLSRASQRSLALSDVDLSETVTGIVERYRDGLKRPIELAITPDVKARTNADSVQQILVSLLDNAQKYSPTGSDIRVGLTSDGQYAIMTVADQGRGITDNQKTKVFDRFYRVDQEIPGNGLGLAIVKQLVVSNHGQIKIVDNAPQGSIFQVSFPISM